MAGDLLLAASTAAKPAGGAATGEVVGATAGTRAAARAGTSNKTGRNTTIWPRFTWQFLRAARDFEPGDYHFRSRMARSEPARLRAA